MHYTTMPTSYESEIVCQRLVETDKTLKDSLGSGLGYVSEEYFSFAYLLHLNFRIHGCIHIILIVIIVLDV